MCCEQKEAGGGSDNLDVVSGPRQFDRSATAWLLGQAVRYLNSADTEGEVAYARTAELLRRCGSDLVETVSGIFRRVQGGDSSLRWSLLYVIGDAGDGSSADFLVQVALRQLTERPRELGCESDRDMDILVGTMAIHALHKVAGRHAEVAEEVLKIVSARPARELLIEAVKVGGELGLQDRLRELLPDDDHWMLDVRKVRPAELFAEPEREDGTERGFTPPRFGELYTAPSACCCTSKVG